MGPSRSVCSSHTQIQRIRLLSTAIGPVRGVSSRLYEWATLPRGCLPHQNPTFKTVWFVQHIYWQVHFFKGKKLKQNIPEKKCWKVSLGYNKNQQGMLIYNFSLYRGRTTTAFLHKQSSSKKSGSGVEEKITTEIIHFSWLILTDHFFIYSKIYI